MCDSNSHLQLLVDTGADVSLIPASHKDRHLPASHTLEAVKCSPINVYSECSMMLLFSSEYPCQPKLTWVFLVANVQQPIPSADFLAHHVLTVDLRLKFLVHQSGDHTCTWYASPIYTVLLNQCVYTAMLHEFPVLKKKTSTLQRHRPTLSRTTSSQLDLRFTPVAGPLHEFPHHQGRI